MPHRLVSLRIVHHRAALFAVRQLIAAHPNDQIHIGEHVLRLHQLPRVALMEQIVDAVRIDSYPARRIARLRLQLRDANRVVGARTLADRVRFVAVRCLFADRLDGRKHREGCG